ncbi:hypothetical protein HPP92_023154 [Vanilla planifolia]|uniref:Uncharacterized protein n=1 Tax=Vanilla planifolia TaxID=51239 RepID=A0A835PTF4_VANPL|nr:hypothetical protein HPP92_023474 [Vanilla planifolia]KAG0460026.1 hypothetical protein HPP92_023154 [Vanilla planifolia]
MIHVGLTSSSPIFLSATPQNRFQALASRPLSWHVLPRHALRSTNVQSSHFSVYSSLSSDSSGATSLPVVDVIERDWSFLDVDTVNTNEERYRKADRVIAAGGIQKGSRVLVCMGSEFFVDRLVESAPNCELLLVAHESLLALAVIKEMYDSVRCWQGQITALPQRFTQFDAVFVCYFPGMGVSLDEFLGFVAGRCSPGARLLISFDQGREVVEGNHRQTYPDMVTADLPERNALEKAAADHAFHITEFVDEPTSYLAVLTFDGSGVSTQLT